MDPVIDAHAEQDAGKAGAHDPQLAVDHGGDGEGEERGQCHGQADKERQFHAPEYHPKQQQHGQHRRSAGAQDIPAHAHFALVGDGIQPRETGRELRRMLACGELAIG